MPGFLKLGDIKGESTDKGHKDWILIESMSSPIHRSIPEGAKDAQRARGDTTLGDVVVVKHLDKSSVKTAEACAKGTFIKEVEVHLCAQIKDKAEPYLKYKLENCIVTSYGFHGHSSGDPLPTEEITMNYTKATWTYVTLDPKTGDAKGNTEGTFTVGEHA